MDCIQQNHIVYMQSDPPQPGHHSASAQDLNRNRSNAQSQSHLPQHLSERSREPLRINADDKSKCVLCIYSAVVIFPLVICIIISVFALPSATKYLNPAQSLLGSTLQNCSGLLHIAPPINTTHVITDGPIYRTLECYDGVSNQVGIYVSFFSNLNQFMLFYIDLNPYAKAQINPNPTLNQNITFSFYSAYRESFDQSLSVGPQLHSSNITVKAKMNRLSQRQYFLGYQSKIAAGQQFFVEVGFQPNSAITSPSMFRLNVETVEQSFTVYTILVRVAFFVLSLLVFIRYYSLLMKVPKWKISVEQRIVQVVGGLTLLFNDQLYFVIVLWPNPFCSFLSALFIWNFLFGLYFLWTSFLTRILYQQPDSSTVQLKAGYRVVLLLLFYCIGLIFCAGYAILQTADYPMISVDAIDQTWFKLYFALLLLCFILALFYLFYLYAEICRTRRYRSHRHSVFMFISLFFTLGIIVCALMGSFEVFNFSAGLVLFTFAFCNFYSYFLQYLYSPTAEQIKRFREIDFELGGWEEKGVEEGKTVNIQLLEIQEDRQEAQDHATNGINSSKNSDIGPKNSGKRVRKRKRDSAKPQHTTNHHSSSKKEVSKGQTQEKILTDEDPVDKPYKAQIELEQQHQPNI